MLLGDVIRLSNLNYDNGIRALIKSGEEPMALAPVLTLTLALAPFLTLALL